MITAADVADITGVVPPLVIAPGASIALTVSGAVERSRWIGAGIAAGTAAGPSSSRWPLGSRCPRSKRGGGRTDHHRRNPAADRARLAALLVAGA